MISLIVVVSALIAFVIRSAGPDAWQKVTASRRQLRPAPNSKIFGHHKQYSSSIMKRTKQLTLLTGSALTILSFCLASAYTKPTTTPAAVVAPAEEHLGNITQLTFGGENAEAYFSADGQRLIFQSTRDAHACDQILR